LKILSWNVERGPLNRRQAIEHYIRKVDADLCILYEASNSSDRLYAFPDWLGTTFCGSYALLESPNRSHDGRGSSGLMILSKSKIDELVILKKFYAVARLPEISILALHLQSPARDPDLKVPTFLEQNFDVDLITGDFNKQGALFLTPTLIEKGYRQLNDEQPLSTHAKGGFIDLTFVRGRPSAKCWYENEGFSASDHVAQVIESG